MANDEYYMKLALREAKKGRYQTWKNPMVGAVIVKNDQILAKGHHIHYGQKHAERDAISKLTPEQLFNSTLYVTLEPCNHYGKQPPCSDLIVKSKIKRVVVGQIDPHKLVTGKGIAKLRANGIEVKTGVLAEQAAELNQFYTYFYQNNHPWMTLKQATSIDYKVNKAKLTRTQVTNQTVYERVHQERADYQAVMIGSNTAIVDNPSLLTSVRTDYPPIRIVIDRRGRLLAHQDLHLLTDGLAPTWIFTQNSDLVHLSLNKKVRVFLLKTDQIKEVLSVLAKKEVQSVYLEGGPTLAAAFLKAGLVNRVIDYVSPRFLGNKGQFAVLPEQEINLHQVKIEKLADNLRIEGEIHV